MAEPGIAVVVPTLDESNNLAACLESARAAADELIVSDGGSQDDTVRLARSLGAEVVEGPPGRGGQLNRGAARATARTIVFLHADSRLPEGAREAILEALNDGYHGGGFRLRFDAPGRMPRLQRRNDDRLRRIGFSIGSTSAGYQ